MKKQLLLLLLLAIAAGSLPAQLLILGPNDTTYVFGDKINVRAQPRTDAPAAAQLLAGDEVVVLEVSPEHSTLNGLDLPWFKVQYGADRKTGFVWGGLLSAWGRQSDGDVRFVANAVKSDNKNPEDGMPTYTLEVRAVRNGAVLHKVSTVLTNGGGIYHTQPEPGARGLAGYRTLLCLNIAVGACGYANDEWFVLWNGRQLVSLPVCTSVADGGVFSHSESYRFPEPAPYDEIGESGHRGDPNRLYFCIEHHEREDLDDDQGWNESNWTRARPMRWDGQKFVRPKNMGEPKEGN